MHVRHWIRYIAGLAGLIGIGDSLVFLVYFRINTGTMLPGFIGLFLLCHVWPPRFFSNWLTNSAFRHSWIGLWICGLILTLGLPIFIIYAEHQQSTAEEVNPAAILVLGSGLDKNGQPGVLLTARLDTAIRVARHFPQVPIIVSGGQGILESISEAQSMQQYLLKNGHLTPSRIWMENQSRNTHENLIFSKQILLDHVIDVTSQQVVIITSDFHTFRTSRLAQHAGFDNMKLIAAPTPWSIRPNTWLREYLAYFKAWGLNQI